MAGGQAVWGLDMGKCALKAVRVRAAAEGKIELVATDHIPHSKILTQPDANRDELIASALEKFLSRNDISSDQVVVSVPGQHTLARFSKLPPLDEKKIPDIVRYEADQQIPFDIDEVIWDYQTFKEEDSPEIEVGIFAMKRELIRTSLLHYENAGIEPVIVQSSPLALYNLATADGLVGDGATVILDIGADSTDLVVATSWSLWTRTIPLGGNAFTEALVKSFKLSFAKAEQLKQTAASSKYARQVFQAMRPVFADLVQELQRSIGFYTSTHRESQPGKCLALGAAFNLPGLQKYIQQNLSLPVKRPEKFSLLTESAAAGAPPFAENPLSFSVALGLAVQGLGLGRVASSLLPPEIAKQAVWRKKRPFFGAAAACLLVAAGAIWIRYFTDVGALAASSGDPVSQVPVEQAEQIISSDLPGNVPAGEYAATIVAAAEALKREYDDLSRQGEQEQQAIQQIVKLQQNQSLMPRVYQVIHEALPRVQEPLASADTPAAYRAAVQANPKDLKREARQQIFIERLSTRYYDNVYEVVLEDKSGAREVDELLITEDMSVEGFIVTLACRTPHRDEVKFVSENFMNRLRELGRRPGMGFFINRVVLPTGQRLTDKPDADAAKDQRHTRQRGPSRGPAPGQSRRGGAPASPSGAAPELAEATYIDAVTNESMDRDWVFTIEFDVYLTDAPEPKPEEKVEETQT